jgi:hypothetical protein
MKTERGSSGRRLVRLGVLLYIVLWAAEAVTKIFSVLFEYAGHDAKSPLRTQLAEGLRILAPGLVLYILKLVALYVLFGVLNGPASPSWRSTRSS